MSATFREICTKTVELSPKNRRRGIMTECSCIFHCSSSQVPWHSLAADVHTKWPETRKSSSFYINEMPGILDYKKNRHIYFCFIWPIMAYYNIHYVVGNHFNFRDWCAEVFGRNVGGRDLCPYPSLDAYVAEYGACLFYSQLMLLMWLPAYTNLISVQSKTVYL